MLTSLFLCVFGGEARRQTMAKTLVNNNRNLLALAAHYETDAICFDRLIADWSNEIYPDYRNELNNQRAIVGLPQM